jgi:hypothetical protein
VGHTAHQTRHEPTETEKSPKARRASAAIPPRQIDKTPNPTSLPSSVLPSKQSILISAPLPARLLARRALLASGRSSASTPSSRGGEYLDQVRDFFPWPEFNWRSVPRVCRRRFLAPPSTRRPLLIRAAGPPVTDSNRLSIPPRIRRAVRLRLCAPDSVRLRYPSSLQSPFHLKP